MLALEAVHHLRDVGMTAVLCGARADRVDHVVPLARWGGWRNGSTSAWRRVRAGVLIRDGFRCQLPVDAAGNYSRDDDVRAATAPIPADPNDPTNLRAACARHNLQRGDGTDRAPWPRRATRWSW